jgi:hypothetical protein
MGIFAWILGGKCWRQNIRSKAKRWDRASLAPHLRVRRLEERRVLNADAAPVQQLIVNAGTAAGDGHADTFVVEQHDNQVRISVNGKEVSNTPIAQIGTINIQGSSDDDVLIAEFKSGEPLAGLHLLFDGKGGADSLSLQGNASINEVNHDFGASGVNHVDAISSAGTASVSYSNVESVNDQLTAQTRTFNFQSGGQQILLNDTGAPSDNLSKLEVNNSFEANTLSIVFKNPAADLTLNTNLGGSGPDSVTLNGIDRNFHGNAHIIGSPDDALNIQGSTDLRGGNIDLISGTVRVEGELLTNHANIEIHAANDILFEQTGSLHNDGGTTRVEAPSIELNGAIVSHGGLVSLDSGSVGTTSVRGSIDVSQQVAGEPAGTVHILGSQIGLFDSAQVDASAAVGAGTILIGGDYQGKNPAIRNALRTYIGQDVVIRADAGTSGNGGKVIVWADEIAQVYGAISARGGSLNGDGGFVETSGKLNLDARGSVDASAPNGRAGTWLLDPTNIVVDAISVVSIQNSLNLDTNVLLSTSGAGPDTGTITVSVPITKSAGLGTAVLTLHADSSITTAATAVISATVGKLGVVLQAGSFVDINAAITTNGADFESTGTTFDNTGAPITTLAGHVLINHTGAVTIGALISSAVLSPNGVSVTGSAVAQNANITATGSGEVDVTATSGNIAMDSSAVTTTIAGQIAYHATGDVSIGLLTSTSGAVIVTADTGNINETNNGANDIVTTGAVTLKADGNIGKPNKLELSGVSNLTLDTNDSFDVSTNVALTALNVTVNPAGGGHSYDLVDIGNLTFDISDGGANLTVTDIHITAGSLNLTVQSDTGNINLHSILLTAGNVTLKAQTGAVVDSLAGESANITTPGTATLIADTGIGSADDIDTAVGTLVATDTTSGNIDIQDTDALIIGAITTSGAANITAGGAITQTGTIQAGAFTAKTLNNAGANITLDTQNNAVTSADLETLNAAGAAGVNAAIAFKDANALTIAKITTGSGAGASAAITAGGLINQTGTIETRAFTAKTLNNAGANITLDTQNNAVTSADLETLNAAGATPVNATIAFKDLDALTIAKITTGSGAGASASITAGGLIDQTGTIETRAFTAKTLNNAGANIALDTQNNAVTSADLETLNAAGAAGVNATIGYKDVDALSITKITTGAGATASAVITAGGLINQTGTIETNAFTAKTLNNAGANIALDTQNNAVTSADLETLNAAGAAAVNAAIAFKDVDALTIAKITTGSGVGASASITAGGLIDQTGTIETRAFTAKTLNNAGANIALDTQNNNVVSADLETLNAAGAAGVNATIAFKDVDALTIAKITTGSGVGASASITSGGLIDQTGTIQTNAFTAKTLNNAGANIALDTQNNAVTSANLRTLDAAGATAVDATIAYKDVDALTIAKITTGSGAGASASITAGGLIDQTGTIETRAFTAKTLNNAGANIALDTQNNAVTSADLETLNAAGAAGVNAAIAFKDVDALTIAKITTGAGATASAAVTAGGLIDQTGTIQTNAFTAKTRNNAGANIALDTQNNAVTSADLETLNAAGATPVNATIAFKDVDALTIAKITTGSGAGASASITAGGLINQTGTIETNAFAAKTLNNAGANIALDTQNNAVTSTDLQTLNAAGATPVNATIAFKDLDALTIAKITTGSGAGASAAITAGGLIDQTGTIETRAFTAKTLNNAGANIALDTQNNAVTSADLETLNAAGAAAVDATIAYKDVDALTITKITTGAGATANAVITAGGLIDQTGTIQTNAFTAKTLNNAGAGITLTNPNNAVASADLETLNAAGAATVDAAISYRDVDALTITKITTGNGATASASITAGGLINQTGTIETNAFTAKTFNNAGAGITLTNPNNAVTSANLETLNAAGAAAVDAAIFYRDVDALTIAKITTGAGASASASITAGGLIDQSGTIQTNAFTAKTLNNAGANIALDTQNNAVTSADLRTLDAAGATAVDATIAYKDIDALTIAKITTGSGAGASASITAGGLINQTGTIETNTFTAKTLNNAGANIALDTQNNAVTAADLETLNAAGAAAVNAAIGFKDVDALTITKITTGNGATASAVITAGGLIDQTGTIQTNAFTAKTLNNAGANITLDTQNNAVTSVDLETLNAAGAAAVNATIAFKDVDAFVVSTIATTGNATLTSGGAVTQTGQIAAGGLELKGTGPYTLTNPANDVTKLAADISGTLSFNDANTLIVGTVGGTAGITTAGKDVTLQALVLDITGSSVKTTGGTDGKVTFIVDTELKSGGTVNAGTATLQIFPATTSNVIEFAAANNGSVTENAFYASGFTSLTAGLVIIGRSIADAGANQIGDIHLGNDAPALTFDHNVQVENSGAGKIILESDYNSSSVAANLKLLSGSGVTFRDLDAHTTMTVNLVNGFLDVTGNATLADNASLIAGGGITFHNNIDADNIALGDRALTLNSTVVSTITVTGTVGAGLNQSLAGLTITQSNGATFAGYVKVTDGVGTITINDTVDGQTVAFQSDLTSNALVVNNAGADNYNVSITGKTNEIGGTTTFANGGTVTLGNEATDSTTFLSGVLATAPSAISIAGIIAATNGASNITLGDSDLLTPTGVTVTADTTVGGSATGLIDLGDVTINDGLTLKVGTGINNEIKLDAIRGVALNAVSNVTLNTKGNIKVDEEIGTDIGAVLVSFANDLTVAGTINAKSMVQTDGTGVTQFKANVTAASVVDLNTHKITVNEVGTIIIAATDPTATIKLKVAANPADLNSPLNLDLHNVRLVTADAGLTHGGQVSDAIFAYDPVAKRFTALDTSFVLQPTFPNELTLSNPNAEVVTVISDPSAKIIKDGTDWFDGTPTDPATEPGVDFGTMNGAPVTLHFLHTYTSNPTGNAATDIPIAVRIEDLAANTIQVTIGGRPLVGTINPTTGAYDNANVIGITKNLVIPVLSLPGLTPQLPVEPLPVQPAAPPVVAAAVETAQAIEAPATFFAESTTGGTSSVEERHYELHVVRFDENGEPEDITLIAKLDDEEFRAIFPFNPSKFPVLFSRLPPDHYRIYLFEDGARRLILDFTIKQGQPVEMPEPEDSSMDALQPGAAPLGDAQPAAAAVVDGHAATKSDSKPSVNDRNATNGAVEAGAAGKQSSSAARTRQRNQASNSADAFAERLGKAAFLSRGGLVVGAAVLACSAGDGWEKSIDRLMERFDRRRRILRRKKQLAARPGRARELSSSNSPNKPK